VPVRIGEGVPVNTEWQSGPAPQPESPQPESLQPEAPRPDALPTGPQPSGPGPVPHHKIGHTRISGLWFAVVFFAVVLLFLLIFILQNGREVGVSYLGAHGHLPLGVALLLSAVCGVLLTILAGVARMTQLRSVARRHRRADAQRQAAPPQAAPR